MTKLKENDMRLKDLLSILDNYANVQIRSVNRARDISDKSSIYTGKLSNMTFDVYEEYRLWIVSSILPVEPFFSSDNYGLVIEVAPPEGSDKVFYKCKSSNEYISKISSNPEKYLPETACASKDCKDCTTHTVTTARC